MRHTYASGWFLPGGAVERGEPDDVALRRELREELGVTELPNAAWHGEFLNTREYKRDTVAVYVIAGLTGAIRLGRELAAADFFPPKALPADLSPGTRRRIEEFVGLARIDGRW